MNTKLKLMLSALALTLSAGHAQAASAPIFFNAANGHYYQAIWTGTNYGWHNAKTAAESMTHNGFRGHLATITSAAENQWISQTFGWAAKGGRYYLGGTDEASEGNWEWITGETWNYTNWAKNEPNNYGSGEDYLQFWNSYSQWNDIFASDNWSAKGYIVEYDNLSPVPVPAAGILFGSALMGLFGLRRFSKKSKA